MGKTNGMPSPTSDSSCLCLRQPAIRHGSVFQLGGSSCALAEPKPTACGRSGSNLGVGTFIIGLCHSRRAQEPQNGELKAAPVLEDTRQMDVRNRKGMDMERAI